MLSESDGRLTECRLLSLCHLVTHFSAEESAVYRRAAPSASEHLSVSEMYKTRKSLCITDTPFKCPEQLCQGVIGRIRHYCAFVECGGDELTSYDDVSLHRPFPNAEKSSKYVPQE